jgi:hypothetical protein
LGLNNSQPYRAVNEDLDLLFHKTFLYVADQVPSKITLVIRAAGDDYFPDLRVFAPLDQLLQTHLQNVFLFCFGAISEEEVGSQNGKRSAEPYFFMLFDKVDDGCHI